MYSPEFRGPIPERPVFAFSHQINEVKQDNGSSEHSFRQQQQTQRKNGRNGNRNGQNQHNNSNFPRTQRVYESVKEDDARSSTKSTSRRTSVSGDEPTVGSYEDRGQDRLFNRQYQRYQKEEAGRYKAGSRGDMLRRNVPQQKEFRENNRDNEYSFESLRSAEFPPIQQSVVHNQFQTTHHLKLKQNETMDLDKEILYTHDNSIMDDQTVSPRSYAATVNSSFDHGKRSRTPSAMEKEDQSSRFPDSDYDPISQQRRMIDKKDPPKVMLAARSKPEKNFGKINLEHKGLKYFNDPPSINKFVENSSFGTRMDPMKLIASVHEASEQLPIINERQFSDVLNDKERELAAASINLDVDTPQDPSFDNSSSMNYDFGAKSPEPLQ